jgi:hypothetical protein
MKEMMKNLGNHVRKKKLEVNVEKKKMMVFNKRMGKSEENEWDGEGRKMEQVNEFKYSGYTFNERTTDKAHITEIVRKANQIVGCVWGMGERKWGGDFRRRAMMFDSMSERKDRDLGMEETKGGRESARNIFEKDARRRQRNPRLYSEGKL